MIRLILPTALLCLPYFFPNLAGARPATQNTRQGAPKRLFLLAFNMNPGSDSSGPAL